MERMINERLVYYIEKRGLSVISPTFIFTIFIYNIFTIIIKDIFDNTLTGMGRSVCRWGAEWGFKFSVVNK